MWTFNTLGILLIVIGFSVGDELGFRQSLSNVEGNKRRSTGARSTGLLPAAASTDYNALMRETGRMYQTYSPRASMFKATGGSSVPPFKPIPPPDAMNPNLVVAIQTKNDTIRRYAASTVPQFAALPASITKFQSPSIKAPHAYRNALLQATDNFQTSAPQELMNPLQLSHRSSIYSNAVKVVPSIDRSSSSSNNAIKPLPTAIPVLNANAITEEKPKPLGLVADTVKSLSAATNLTEETISAAIAMKQQQLLQQQQQSKLTTTTTTTTNRPMKITSSVSKVMNAPKEYYPVGYDKNFDDNFVSRVELPDTSFYCGEQKHFPGLYADEDLGCMVFHVCAFTDDGLIMKSFLCPESTLFDQSILKCNWWFYVDCKSSKKLYDSNIPISKSYQLMKALSFFSSYNKGQQ